PAPGAVHASDGQQRPAPVGAIAPGGNRGAQPVMPMTTFPWLAFLPELVLLFGALALFLISLGEARSGLARIVALLFASATIVASLMSLGQNTTLFNEAYRVDAFSQILKLVFACGFALVLLLGNTLEDIREDVKPEYFLFLTLSVCGLTLLV